MERVKDLNMDEEQMMKDIQKGRYNHSILYIFLDEKQWSGFGMFIPDPNDFHPGSWIRIK